MHLRCPSARHHPLSTPPLPVCASTFVSLFFLFCCLTFAYLHCPTPSCCIPPSYHVPPSYRIPTPSCHVPSSSLSRAVSLPRAMSLPRAASLSHAASLPRAVSLPRATSLSRAASLSCTTSPLPHTVPPPSHVARCTNPSPPGISWLHDVSASARRVGRLSSCICTRSCTCLYLY